MRRLFSVIAIVIGVVQLSAQPFPLDYSYCGYRMSELPVPNAQVAVVVSNQGKGDQSARIQRAIDYVSALKPDRKTGLRGAVLLERGTYEIVEPLRIQASGVVLRGADKKATVLLKKGVDRGAAVYLEGRCGMRVTDTLDVVSAVVGLGSRELMLSGTVSAGEEIVIWRPSTKEWIESLGCATFGGGKDLGYWGWHPGEIDVRWTRKVASVVANSVTLDAPLSMELNGKWGQTKVLRFAWPERIADSGVENLSVVSDYDRSSDKDEDHCWDGIYIANARDCWVRMVDFRHLAGSAVVVQRSASQITVEDCVSKEPVGEVGGYRRRTFHTLGEKCLFQRCYSECGVNDFSAGFCAAGPNAFVQCDSRESLGYSGSVGPWATGLLFDDVNIDGNDLKFMNLRIEKYGTGWNTANSLAYQSTAAGIFCDSPDSAQQNMVYGCWAQFCGDGIFAESNNHVKPWSLFAEQLRQRLGRDVSAQCRVLERPTGASSSPTIEEAIAMTAETRTPRTTMEAWIDSARLAVDVKGIGAKSVDRLKVKDNGDASSSRLQHEIAVRDGRLVRDGALLVGGRHNTPWWNGRVREPAIEKATYAVTRFIPGMEGRGATDRLDSVVAEMKKTNILVFNQNYGLWYDRRRDDHERVRRRDGDVWPPFYEQPFARSGQGTAWDGLSKYDLKRLNKWYYQRLDAFAVKAESEGMLLLHQHYFQHNILEAGAHWVDCPWRTANNINESGFPEPVPFTGDKRVFMAEYFYDVDHPVHRELHRNYILQTLDAFKDRPNVVHSIGEEFTGPLHFVQFWLDTVHEWEQQTGRKVLISLAVNKDVQDAILSDSARSQVVDIIDIEQWYYHQKGIYAPEGGVNMAPRQYMRKIKGGSVRFEDVYRAVSEYRKAYPDKAVAYYAQKYPEMCWAVLMAGGSCPALPCIDKEFLQDVARMSIGDEVAGMYVLKNDDLGALVYK
ncbi:MAG: pectate lyase, partial [Prevotella sp.]|nr:pectate lyase [Prevotella sp.]